MKRQAATIAAADCQARGDGGSVEMASTDIPMCYTSMARGSKGEAVPRPNRLGTAGYYANNQMFELPLLWKQQSKLTACYSGRRHRFFR